MARALSVDMLSEIEEATIRPFYLFEAAFSVDTLRLYSGSGDLSWDSETWLGNGWFRGLGSIRETGEIQATGIDVILNGVPSALVSLVLSQARQNLSGKLYLGFFDAAGDIIEDPYLLFEGGLDVPRVRDAYNDSTITLTYESNLVRLKRKKELRYTDQMQKQMFPGDYGFGYMVMMAEWSGYWGTKIELPTGKAR